MRVHGAELRVQAEIAALLDPAQFVPQAVPEEVRAARRHRAVHGPPLAPGDDTAAHVGHRRCDPADVLLRRDGEARGTIADERTLRDNDRGGPAQTRDGAASSGILVAARHVADKHAIRHHAVPSVETDSEGDSATVGRERRRREVVQEDAARYGAASDVRTASDRRANAREPVVLEPAGRDLGLDRPDPTADPAWVAPGVVPPDGGPGDHQTALSPDTDPGARPRSAAVRVHGCRRRHRLAELGVR